MEFSIIWFEITFNIREVVHWSVNMFGGGWRLADLITYKLYYLHDPSLQTIKRTQNKIEPQIKWGPLFPLVMVKQVATFIIGV